MSVYRRQSERPVYVDPNPPRLERPKPWLKQYPWPLEHPIATVLLAISCTLVVLWVRFEIQHPCTKRGPEYTTYIWQSCGKDCSYMQPITTRDCLERAP